MNDDPISQRLHDVLARYHAHPRDYDDFPTHLQALRRENPEVRHRLRHPRNAAGRQGKRRPHAHPGLTGRMPANGGLGHRS